MSEYISLNKSGQWELHKATNFHDGNNTQPKNISEAPGDKPFKVFRGNAKDGELHEDKGTRGELHDFNGGIRPKAERVNFKNAGKPSQPVDSVYAERKPRHGNRLSITCRMIGKDPISDLKVFLWRLGIKSAKTRMYFWDPAMNREVALWDLR